MLKQKLIYIIICILFLNNVHAQHIQMEPKQKSSTSSKSENKKKDFWDRIFIGGGLGASFGTYTFVDVEPIVGYKVTEKLHIGTGFVYTYAKMKDPNPNYSYESHSLGGSVFGRYYIFKGLFTQAQYQYINTHVNDYYNQSYNYDYSNMFIGGGYLQSFGDNSYSGIYVMLLYDVIESKYSPYNNPWLSIGFSIGL